MRTPCTLMSVLLEQWSLGGDEEGEWLRGGAMPRCPVKREKDLLCNNKKLCCVYDFCTCDTPFDGLEFLLDVGRAGVRYCAVAQCLLV